MNASLLEPVELRSRGFDALVETLGWVNAVRFIQQFEKSNLNYTTERDVVLPNLDAAEMIGRMDAMREASSKR